jgi:hypothetical protein
MAMIDGTLHLDLLPQKGVRLLFTPLIKGANARPLGIPNTEQALSDLENFWGCNSTEAQAAIEELRKNGSVEIRLSIEEQAVSSLFV